MRTEDLIRTLATGAGPVESRTASRRYVVALAVGSLGALAVVAADDQPDDALGTDLLRRFDARAPDLRPRV